MFTPLKILELHDVLLELFWTTAVRWTHGNIGLFYPQLLGIFDGLFLIICVVLIVTFDLNPFFIDVPVPPDRGANATCCRRASYSTGPRSDELKDSGHRP